MRSLVRSELLLLYAAVTLLGAVVTARGQGAGQQPASLGGSIKAALEAPPQLTVGDPFWYVVVLQVPEESAAELPGNETAFPPFEIRDYATEESTATGGMRQITLRYQLVGFQVGEHEIAGLRVQARRTVGGKEQVDKYVAPPVKVTISSVLPGQEAQTEPIFGPLMIRPWWHSWVLAALIALLILAALTALVWLWLRRRKARVDAAERELTPHERAVATLTALRDGKLIAGGRFKDFYSELGDALRRWLEYRARIEAMEATTALIRHDLRRSSLPEDWQRDLIALLSRGDLVKFAKWTPDDTTAYADLDTAFALLERGRLREPEQEAVA